jgi:hypothetical protein
MIKWLRSLFTKKVDEYDKWMEAHPDYFLDYDDDL